MDHGRLDVFVPEQILNRPDVGTIVEWVYGKGMAEGMANGRASRSRSRSFGFCFPAAGSALLAGDDVSGGMAAAAYIEAPLPAA